MLCTQERNRTAREGHTRQNTRRGKGDDSDYILVALAQDMDMDLLAEVCSTAQPAHDSLMGSVEPKQACSLGTPQTQGGNVAWEDRQACGCSALSVAGEARRQLPVNAYGVRIYKPRSSSVFASPAPAQPIVSAPVPLGAVVTPEPTLREGAPVHKSFWQTNGSGMRMFKRKAQSASTLSTHCTSLTPIPAAFPGVRSVDVASGTAQNAPDPSEGKAIQDVCSLNRAMALLKSPTSKPSQPRQVCVSSAVVPYVPNGGGGGRIFGNGTELSSQEVREIKLAQRNSSGMYCTRFFFPSMATHIPGANVTDHVRLERQSLRRAGRYLCDGCNNCLVGDCLAMFQDSDVYRFRHTFMGRRVAQDGKTLSQVELLVNDLCHSWNRTTDTWQPIVVTLDAATSASVCASAYGLLCGCVSSTLRYATEQIKNSTNAVRTLVAKPVWKAREERSEDWNLLCSYVADLVNRHEANPAPGAHQPGRMTHITKRTWKRKWADVEVYFQKSPRVPGSMSMLKKAWKLETRLKEKKACSHSKCNVCSKIDTIMDSVRGVNTSAAQVTRANSRRAQAEHDRMHLAARTEMDDAGRHAFVSPRQMWTMLVDAATQRNFMLPKLQCRAPKKLAQRPFWSYKLMASYAYGYGFTPFLVHSSQKMGANLTWTVIWLTLTAMRKHYGFWPDVLHITVDNTTGENKNETLLAMCAWLVASGRFKQVRVLFLMVGHTHVIIDHIFGVVTVGLRRKELLLPVDLIRNIEASLAANPQYMAKPVQVLHCLWNFKDWCNSTMKPHPVKRLFRGHVQDREGTYSGMYDLLFSRSASSGCRMKYREHCTHAWRPDESEGVIVVDELPSSPPGLQDMKPWKEWAMDGSKSVKETIIMCFEYARTVDTGLNKQLVRNAWERQWSIIPDSIELLHQSLRLEFEFFRDVQEDVLRVGMRPVVGTSSNSARSEDEDGDASYTAWKQQNLDIRTHPLALDPVVSTEQSEAEYSQRKASLQEAMRPDLHPTIDSNSPIFLGEYVLVLNQQATGVDLFNVATIPNMCSPFADDLEFVGVLYEHCPNAAVSGLFGSFKMQMTQVNGDKKQQTRRTCNRAQVKVFNVSIISKTKVLSIRSLRMLALALPEQYPFPNRRDIPVTHLEDDSFRSQARRRGGSPQPRSAGRAAARRPPKQTAKSQKTSTGRGAVASSDSSSSDPDSDDSSDSSSSQSDSSSSSDSEGNDTSNDLPADSTASTTTPEDVPLLMAPTNGTPPKVDTVIALSMVNDVEYKQYKYPFTLVYVCQSEPLVVYWFHLPESQLAPRSGGRQARDFKPTNKYLTFQKYWTNINWCARGTIPTEAQILEHWYKQAAHINWVLSVAVPQCADALKIRTTDSFKLPMQWVQDVMIPVCKAACCEQ